MELRTLESLNPGKQLAKESPAQGNGRCCGAFAGAEGFAQLRLFQGVASL